jgi:5-methylcytosine-specific restriction endonuclease McrA
MDAVVATSPHIPAAMKREVYARDEGQCAFVAEDGRRCCETGGLEFDHIDGLAQTHVHDVNRIRLTCRAHNQHAAEQLYGRVFMDRLRESRKEAKGARCRPVAQPLATEIAAPGCPGASGQQSLF